MTETEALAEKTLLQRYQNAINKLANEMLDDFRIHNGLDSDPKRFAPTILKHLNMAYPQFEWHYNRITNKIWHTIKINHQIKTT